jgi:hypothetical protein
VVIGAPQSLAAVVEMCEMRSCSKRIVQGSQYSKTRPEYGVVANQMKAVRTAVNHDNLN